MLFSMRYSRQNVLDVIGKKGQDELANSSVAVVGIGALGTNSVELLTRAGIGKLILVDNEKIEISNLQRQTLFAEEDIGKYKADIAKIKLKKINSEVKIIAFKEYLNNENIIKIIKADIILDCTDNLETRFIINDFALKNKIPWIYSAAIRTKGFVFNIKGRPCLRCFLNKKSDVERCEDVGILNTISTIISSIQVTQALKILLNKDYEKNLISFDAWENKFERIKVKKNKKCLACKGVYEFLEKKKLFNIKFCESDNTFSVRPNRETNLDLNKIKNNFEIDIETPIFLTIKDHGGILIHKYGEIDFKTLKNEKKIKEIAENIYNY